ncbi:hypothetical protein RN001_004726 [Aquatica leii]|uniref:Uncharacterized protein n=1 Tax=Aquatica leii TaxID=1421715 RepID=A0AAN7Q098_9COLE|nr:hypothetical protein RN001_004726 [Aquatica leii]
MQHVDEDTELPVAGGSCTIFAKLLERATYLNRPHKKEKNNVSPSVPPALRKRKANSMAGCSQWQPEKTSNVDKSNNDRVILNSINQTNPSFYQLLEASYADQRTFLNNILEVPSVLDIQREWPVLFNKYAIKWHFNKLTGSNLDFLSENLNNKAAKIVQFGLDTSKLISCIETEDLNYQSLKVLSKYFKEDFSLLYYKFKYSTDIEEILKVNAPCIVEICNY